MNAYRQQQLRAPDLYHYRGIAYTYDELRKAHRKQQLTIQAAIDRGDYNAACEAANLDTREFLPQIAEQQTGDKMTLTPRRKCGIIKAIRRYVRRWKQKREGKKMKIDRIIEKINNSCKPFDIDDLREIFTAAKYSEGLETLKTCEDTDEIPLEIIDNALFILGYVADDAGTYRKK